MGISVAQLEFTESTANATVYLTATSYTPAPNTLILAFVWSNGTAPLPDDGDFAGNGLTWVKISSVPANTIASPIYRLTVFRAMGTAPVTGQGVASFTGSKTGCSILIMQFSGVDTSGANGSGAIVQFVNGSEDVDPDDYTISLAPLTGLQNAVIAGFTNDFNPFDATPEALWTEQLDEGIGLPVQGAYCTYRIQTIDNSVRITPGTTGGSWGGVALEIKVAPDTGGKIRAGSGYVAASYAGLVQPPVC